MTKLVTALLALVTLAARSGSSHDKPAPGRSAYLHDVASITRTLPCPPDHCQHAGVLHAMADVEALHDGLLFCRALRDGKIAEQSYATLHQPFLTLAQQLERYAIPDLCPES